MDNTTFNYDKNRTEYIPRVRLTPNEKRQLMKAYQEIDLNLDKFTKMMEGVGAYVQSELHSSRGRLDSIVHTAFTFLNSNSINL